MGTQEIAVPDVVFDRGFHMMTEYDYCGAVKKWLASMPVRSWAELEVGGTYMHKDYRGNYMAFSVVRITPSRAKTTVREWGDDYDTDFLKGSYQHVEFIHIDDSLISMLGVTHEMIVEEAVNRGLPVPPEVRCAYPGFFVEVPERFTKAGGHPVVEVFGLPKGNKYYDGPATSADRLREVLQTCIFRGGPCTPEKVNGWIERAHQAISKVTCYYIRLNEEDEIAQQLQRGDMDKLVSEFLVDIDFYRWLLPLVSEGGVFHIPQVENDQAVA